MTPYIPLGIGSAAVVVVLVLMFTPTECFVMQNDYYESPSSRQWPLEIQPLRLSLNPDGSVKLTKKILSGLEESDVIVVKNSPNNVLEAIMFWADEGATTVPHHRVAYRSYHIECTDHISQTVQWLYPSAFPNSVHESIAYNP